MKLRIQGNSVRLRLSRGEVARLAAMGSVSDTVDFGPSKRMVYSLETADGGNSLRAEYDDGSMRFFVPARQAHVWAETDQVAISGEQNPLQILIEKDFKCIHKGDEENSDAFPNPLQEK